MPATAPLAGELRRRVPTLARRSVPRASPPKAATAEPPPPPAASSPVGSPTAPSAPAAAVVYSVSGEFRRRLGKRANLDLKIFLS